MKAITLISGGLDSILAAKLVKAQGIDIIPLHFKIPFCHSNKKNPSKDADKLCQAVSNLGIDLKIIDISNEFLNLLVNPEYGFGSNMNPCIDCRILMLRKAKELMPQLDAAFVVTGEVLGQRPMSQNKQSLGLIEKRAGLGGLVLRPLSAKHLAQTIPEQNSWVCRERLLDFSGRGRRPQIELAKTFNIQEYAQPAGGCLLTDAQFAKRVKDLLDYRQLNLNNIGLLKIGRHFRVYEDTKLVVGRDESENGRLVSLAKEGDYLFMSAEIKGPTALGRGFFSEELLKISCSITCRYCDLNGKIAADIIYKKVPQEKYRRLAVAPLPENEISQFRI